MGQIGIYVERYTISNSEEMNALMRFVQVARKLGHRADFFFRPDMDNIPQYDAVFIRALTDPLNSSYVTSRTAEMHGVRVVDDPDSIRICCDKVDMYRHLMQGDIPMPETRFIEQDDLCLDLARTVLRELGSPVVLKAPNSSFSMHVDRADSPEAVVALAKRYFRRADRVIVQRYVRSSFDWRVGVLGGEPLYVCQYVIPRKSWKILTYTMDGRTVYGSVKAIALKNAPAKLLDIAVRAADTIGKGLYGVDLKQVGEDYTVIEVNDNPTIAAGEEDREDGDLYERLVTFLMR